MSGTRLAAFERAMIQERVRGWAGSAQASAKGKRLGRPRIDPRNRAAYWGSSGQGRRAILQMATDLGVGSGTVQRVKAALSRAA